MLARSESQKSECSAAIVLLLERRGFRPVNRGGEALQRLARAAYVRMHRALHLPLLQQERHQIATHDSLTELSGLGRVQGDLIELVEVDQLLIQRTACSFCILTNFPAISYDKLPRKMQVIKLCLYSGVSGFVSFLFLF